MRKQRQHSLIVRVLGSGAGGGVPQWNCNARLSRMAWDGDPRIRARTQSSIAVSADLRRWVIVNTSPDLRQQIWANPELQPARDEALRNSPIKAVILTNGDIDHIAGLLSLRERQPFRIYATPRVLSILSENSVFGVLASDVVERVVLPINQLIEIPDTGGVMVEAFPVPGKVALYLEDASKGPGFGTQLGDTIGLKLSAEGRPPAVYMPGCARIDDSVLRRVRGASCLLFDGTVFEDSELVALGVSDKTGQRMGHIAIAGENGSLHAFDNAEVGRKVYIHINTTNPILEEGSSAEEIVKEAGWEVAFDGMKIIL
jgi:pyrroloquinoline quinone biosynthesis protein B